jgi:hypothetical protein
MIAATTKISEIEKIEKMRNLRNLLLSGTLLAVVSWYDQSRDGPQVIY